MTQIPHPSNMTDQDQQRTHYFRQIAEQLARIADALEKSASPTSIPPGANMTDRSQLQTFNLRQVAIQLSRTADVLEARAAAAEPKPPNSNTRKAKRTSAS
jgi:hypothetical protein